ncbi:MAG: hypothetical protein JXJ04_17745 [Spirochaetales bacterium]|nr:hypothetical protein [Spirochaetales bacterium]
MPFVVHKKDVDKAITSHLTENEEVIAVLLSRGMQHLCLALTNQKSVKIIDMPLVGSSRIKEEFHVDEITSLDYFPVTGGIKLILTAIEHPVVFALPFLHSDFPIKEEFRKFIREIRIMNPGARPDYLEKNENVIETIKVKQGIFKLTENNIFLFKSPDERKETWEITEKIPFHEIQEFDYYPETEDILFLYIENNRGESRVFKLENKALFLNDHAACGNPDLIIENIYESITPHRKKPVPSYLYDDEEVVTTFRGFNHDSGPHSPDLILRLTTKRLIELFREKQGSLDLRTEIELEQCEKISIRKADPKRDGEESGADYILSVILAEDKNYEYGLNKEFQYAVDKLYALYKE